VRHPLSVENPITALRRHCADGADPQTIRTAVVAAVRAGHEPAIVADIAQWPRETVAGMARRHRALSTAAVHSVDSRYAEVLAPEPVATTITNGTTARIPAGLYSSAPHQPSGGAGR
jgi:hypothetical protein